MTDQIRLDKFLAGHGLTSRRGVTFFLNTNRVLINGERVTTPGVRFDSKKDSITINDKKISRPALVYILLNKPKGFVSTLSDEKGRKEVTTLIKSKERIYPVGRLDQASRGLMLLANDGELTYQLTHPKFHIPNTYIVTVSGSVGKEKIVRLRKGVRLEEGITSQAEVVVIKESQLETTLRFVLHEGWKRQIRRMCESVKLKVIDLERISIGPLQIGKLGEGKYRNLEPMELKKLRDAVGMKT